MCNARNMISYGPAKEDKSAFLALLLNSIISQQTIHIRIETASELAMRSVKRVFVYLPVLLLCYVLF